jgi:hypothetical protein
MTKTIIISLALLFQIAAHHKAPPIEVGEPMASVALIKPIKISSLKELTELPYAPLPFAPMGTYGNSYAPNNCTWGASSMEPAIPQSWGNADTWDDSARAEGVVVSSQPILGAVAQTDAGGLGHVAVVTAITADGPMITEMNYDYMGGVRTRLALPGEFVYIYV